jgi:hypothetical protein
LSRVAKIKAKIPSNALEDIYNMDETAYLYNFALDKTIETRRTERAKKDKTRITTCWRRAGLLDAGVSEPSEFADCGTIIDDTTRADYEPFIVRADLRHAMSIDEFPSPAEGEEILLEIGMVDEAELKAQFKLTKSKKLLRRKGRTSQCILICRKRRSYVH